MIRSVRRGNSFADTMKDQGDAFPELLINMFRAAQSQAVWIRQHLEWQSIIKRSIV